MPKLVSELSFSWKGTFGKKSQPKNLGGESSMSNVEYMERNRCKYL